MARTISLCKEESCPRPVEGRGMCSRHYRGWLRNVNEPGYTCFLEGCERPRVVRAMCQTHYVAYWRLHNKAQDKANKVKYWRKNGKVMNEVGAKRRRKLQGATYSAPRHGMPWSSEDDAVLWSGVSNIEAAFRLQRTFHSIENRRRRIRGVHK